MLREKQKEKRPSKCRGLQGNMWNSETLLVVILRGEAHRLYHDNFHLRNIKSFHGACAEVFIYTRVSEVRICQRRFQRKWLILDTITCRAITLNFTPIGNKFGNWVRFPLRQISRNSRLHWRVVYLKFPY